jgi:hypothetical protein
MVSMLMKVEKEDEMKVFVGIAGAALIVIGVVVLMDAASITGVRSVMHQQYVTMEVILGSMLVSFGLLCCGVAGVIDAIDRLAPQRDALSEPVAPATMAERLGVVAR